MIGIQGVRGWRRSGLWVSEGTGVAFLEDVVQGEGVVRLACRAIRPSPFQPRREFGADELSQLAESIRAHGVIQPVLVRPVAGGFELIAGERRWRAAQEVGLDEIPALVRPMEDHEAAVVALVENVQRENLHFFEEAEAYQKLIHGFGLTQQEVAARVGRSQGAIANRLRLLRLPQDVREVISREMMSERHARALLQLPSADLQREVIRRIVRGGLTVRDTEKLIDGLLREGVRKRRESRMRGVIRDIRIFLNAFRQAADALRGAGIPAEIREQEADDAIEIYVRIPKAHGRSSGLVSEGYESGAGQ